ncbi:uncharacterized protein LOC127105655 [Lathyrus oleraceus]|uniref:uncharacterized protein LOC127105655 n=1 Tax=Pisum sativum TaxID=3888 RepID=UPI0021CF5A82|nr:uncharacterized protein LOC127105655 [Pisum sativum]
MYMALEFCRLGRLVRVNVQLNGNGPVIEDQQLDAPLFNTLIFLDSSNVDETLIHDIQVLAFVLMKRQFSCRRPSSVRASLCIEMHPLEFPKNECHAILHQLMQSCFDLRFFHARF